MQKYHFTSPNNPAGVDTTVVGFLKDVINIAEYDDDLTGMWRECLGNNLITSTKLIGGAFDTDVMYLLFKQDVYKESELAVKGGNANGGIAVDKVGKAFDYDELVNIAVKYVKYVLFCFLVASKIARSPKNSFKLDAFSSTNMETDRPEIVFSNNEERRKIIFAPFSLSGGFKTDNSVKNLLDMQAAVFVYKNNGLIDKGLSGDIHIKNINKDYLDKVFDNE